MKALLFSLFLVFSLSANTQMLPSKAHRRFQQAQAETPYIDITTTWRGEDLVVISRPPQEMGGRAFLLLSYHSPAGSFTARPLWMKVFPGELWAAGKGVFYGEVVRWRLEVKVEKALTQWGREIFPVRTWFCLKIVKEADDRVLLLRGEPERKLLGEIGHPAVIQPAPDNINLPELPLTPLR